MLTKKEAWLYLAALLTGRDSIEYGLCTEATYLLNDGYISDATYNEMMARIHGAVGGSWQWLAPAGELQPRIDLAWKLYEETPA